MKFKISKGYDDGSVSSQVEVEGVLLFELYGYQWAAHQEKEDDADGEFFHWIVSEVSTGFELESGKYFEDKEEAKEWAYNYLLKKGEGLTRFHIEKARMKLQEYETIINQSTSIRSILSARQQKHALRPKKPGMIPAKRPGQRSQRETITTGSMGKHRNDFTDMFWFFLRCLGWFILGCTLISLGMLWVLNKIL